MVHCAILDKTIFFTFFPSFWPYFWSVQQRSSRESQWRRWCWIQGRGQRGLQERRWTPPGPSWCSSQTLRNMKILSNSGKGEKICKFFWYPDASLKLLKKRGNMNILVIYNSHPWRFPCQRRCWQQQCPHPTHRRHFPWKQQSFQNIIRSHNQNGTKCSFSIWFTRLYNFPSSAVHQNLTPDFLIRRLSLCLFLMGLLSEDM